MNADLMASQIDALLPTLEQADARAARLTSIKAICQGIVAHLQSNMQINGVAGVGLVAPPGGGPVTGAVILLPGSIT